MSERPRRVLHIVRAMNRGGAETWLMDLLRRADRRRLQMDFLVHTEQPAAYDAEIQDRGARLLRCSEPLYSWGYARSIRSRFQGYDVIHSHVHHFSGYLLLLARTCGVVRRIAHSHNDTQFVDNRAGWARRQYLAGGRRLIQSHATRLLAVSRGAARALYGPGWENDARVLVMPCGIDLEPFRKNTNRDAVRQQWNAGDRTLVIGHVGRFDIQKNHPFLLEVAAEVLRRRPETRLVMIGDGPERPSIEAGAQALGIRESVIFAGIQTGIPGRLKGMDIFLFPSLWEGLPLALLEAQAAGLPCIVSESVPPDADAVPSLVHRLALSHGAAQWADAVLSMAERPPATPQPLAQLATTSFDIACCMEQMYALYDA